MERDLKIATLILTMAANDRNAKKNLLQVIMYPNLRCCKTFRNYTFGRTCVNYFYTRQKKKRYSPFSCKCL